MLTYRHRKHAHTQTVEEWETVKIRLLEQAGWRKVSEPLPDPEPAKEKAPTEEPKPKTPKAESRNPTKRKWRKNAHIGNLPEDDTEIVGVWTGDASMPVVGAWHSYSEEP